MIGLLVLVSACKKEINPVAATQTGSKILVTGQDAGTGLKSALNGQTTEWIQTSDKVGIYSADARTTNGGATAIVNAQFSAAASGPSSAFTGEMYWRVASTDHTFYAYYPYKAGSAAPTVVPVSLASAQIQSAADNSNHIGALDFMVATPVTVNSPGIAQISNTAVHLSYNHLFIVLEFQITGSGTLNAVKLSSTSNTIAFSSGTINITQTPPDPGVAYTFASQTGTTTQAVVTLTTPSTLSGTAKKVYMVINPKATAEYYYVGLLVGSTWTYIKQYSPTGGFLRGKKYIVAVSTTSAGAAPSGAPIDPAIDVEGNTYTTVTIGTQTWMTSNLKTTKYKDGTEIPNVTDGTAWKNLITPGYCWYNNDATTYKSTYGALYNWYAVNTAKLCPTGWHVPTHTEWTTLTTYLGSATAGDQLKETGTTHWPSPNTGTNTSGFTALPGGERDFGGAFGYISSFGIWWSSTDMSTFAYRLFVNGNAGVVTDNYDYKESGMSVRCLQD